MSVQDTVVIVSLSWLVQRRGAEVPVLPSLCGDAVRRPQSENSDLMHGERMGSALKYIHSYFNTSNLAGAPSWLSKYWRHLS